MSAAAEQLVHRSNLLGADQRVTNTGGGNTSAKLMEIDPETGEPVQVLWVKGSGGDLRTSRLENFASLYQGKLLAVHDEYLKRHLAEDDMVARYPACSFNGNPRAASIDTPLHAFIPHAHVDHMHPNAVIAVAASRNSERLTREVFGDEIGWTPWRRPGFELGLELERLCRARPGLLGVVLAQHGLINWADDSDACYQLTLRLIRQAEAFIERHDKEAATFGGAKYPDLPKGEREAILIELLPWLRAQLGRIATVQYDPGILRFANSNDAGRLAALGTSCPDHFLRTKIKPLFVDWTPGAANLREILTAGLAQYRADYAAYYERCKRPDSPPMRDPNPSVILIPGLGMIAWGGNKSESRVTAEFYNCAVEVMRGAEAIDEYIALDPQEAFDIEYWSLEEAKLRRMPPEKPLARKVALVYRAEDAHRLAAQGAHIVCTEELAREITAKYGHGIGVAGTGISGCGPAAGVDLDDAHRQGILAFGGIDYVVESASDVEMMISQKRPA